MATPPAPDTGPKRNPVAVRKAALHEVTVASDIGDVACADQNTEALDVDASLEQLKASLATLLSRHQEDINELIECRWALARGCCNGSAQLRRCTLSSGCVQNLQPAILGEDETSASKVRGHDWDNGHRSIELLIDGDAKECQKAQVVAGKSLPLGDVRSEPDSKEASEDFKRATTNECQLAQAAAKAKNQVIQIGQHRRAPLAIKKIHSKLDHGKHHHEHKDAISSAQLARIHGESSCLERVVSGKLYEVAVMCVVTLNASFIGYQTQDLALRSARGLAPVAYPVTDSFFIVVFSTEMFLRLMAYRCKFLYSSDWSWNIFDLAVVAVMWFEAALGHVDAIGIENPMLSQMSILRIMRIMRIVRILRIIRVLKFFRELRLMLSSILNSMLSLFWAMTLLGIMFYIFGLSLTQGAVDYLNEVSGWDQSKFALLKTHFGRLDSSVMSLFQGMAGGMSWGELCDDLAPLSWNYLAIFLSFVSISMFAVLNIVTGVFVQTAMERSQEDRETLIQDAMAQKESYLEKMHHVFQELDANDSGTLSADELEAAIQDERMGAYFDALGLNIEDIDTLFELLDRNQEGFIDIDEFLQGCLKLRGEARGLDMAIIQYENKWLMHNMSHVVALLEPLMEQNREQNGGPLSGSVERSDPPALQFRPMSQSFSLCST